MRGRNNGFTLIELLIVIVLIGILSAVLITIINPSKQQGAANDGTVRATLNKVILAAESFNSSYGRVANEWSFYNSLDFSASQLGGNSCVVAGTPDYECLFSIQGINLSQECNVAGWTDATQLGTDQCYFRYQGNISGDTSRFRIYVKSVGIRTSLFVFDNQEGGEVFECPLDFVDGESIVARCQ